MIRLLFTSFTCIFLTNFASAAPPFEQVLDRAVVISLDRHRHRFEETKTLMQKAGFTNIERFQAIDGFFSEESFFENLGIFKGSPGQKGCTASHLLVWKNFLESSEKPYLFVAEDDMLPHFNFMQLFPMYWEKTPKDFDIVMVGNQLESKNREDFILKKRTACTHAYIISRKGAIKLLKLYKKSSLFDLKQHAPIFRGDIKKYVIDMFLSKMMYKNKIIYYCYKGKMFPDKFNKEKGNIIPKRDSGICFQNASLGSSIHAIEITPL